MKDVIESLLRLIEAFLSLVCIGVSVCLLFRIPPYENAVLSLTSITVAWLLFLHSLRLEE